MEETEARIMDLWRIAQRLSVEDPDHLAANYKGLVEAKVYLNMAIAYAAQAKRSAA
jgi:hypothetical protein